MSKKSFTVDEILEKMQNYCTYQDRCHWEVEKKLRTFDLIPEAYDKILIALIQDNFLNEERFAKSFARGKFNQNKWGRNKIIREMKSRRIPENLIEKGLEEIDEAKYREVLEELYHKKEESLKSERDSFKKKSKIANYLLQKGYENELIWELLR